MKHFFLGTGAGISKKERIARRQINGTKEDYQALKTYLLERYQGKAALLTINGRSAIAAGLKYAVPEKGEVIVNAFTCRAVVQAIQTAGMTPVYADILPENLNFTVETTKHLLTKKTRAIIIQNTLGNMVNIAEFEEFCRENHLILIEDLAHCLGRVYPDGREAGTVGEVVALSFGKEKALDAGSGGALILKNQPLAPLEEPTREPSEKDIYRARIYPTLGHIYRKLSYFGLQGPFMRLMLQTGLIVKSAEGEVDFTKEHLSFFQSRLVLNKLKQLKPTSSPLRTFYLINDRDACLKELKNSGYYFDGFWYERPISPERYYKSLNFPEKTCKNAVFVAQHIINFPTYYPASSLEKAQKIVEKYLLTTPVDNPSGNPAPAKNTPKTAEKWQKTIEKYPEANFLQSPSYSQMNQTLGAKTFVDDLGGQGWVLAIVRDAKRGRYLEIPCGPLIDWQNPDLVRATLDKISALAQAEHCVFVRLRPQLTDTPENLALLGELGLKKSPMHLAAEHTVIIDLTKSEDEILKSMRRQTRYEVRRAEKLGIKVEKSNSEEIFRQFFKEQQKTAARQGFVPPSLKTLEAERASFGDNIQIYTAKTAEKGEPIAYGLILKDGREADYYEAASTELNHKLPGAYALLWQAIKDLKKEGYERFNLWGIAPPGVKNHRYSGVTTFKTGFGGEVVSFVPAHDLILNQPKYLKNLIVETARKKRRHL